jgi:hypothetical protein
MKYSIENGKKSIKNSLFVMQFYVKISILYKKTVKQKTIKSHAYNSNYRRSWWILHR